MITLSVNIESNSRLFSPFLVTLLTYLKADIAVEFHIFNLLISLSKLMSLSLVTHFLAVFYKFPPNYQYLSSNESFQYFIVSSRCVM